MKPHLQTAFKSLNRLGLDLSGAYFNADKAFDTKAARKTGFNHGLISNIDENKRNRNGSKRGRKRLFNTKMYKRRFTSERSFAWIDKFKALLLRFDRPEVYFLQLDQFLGNRSICSGIYTSWCKNRKKSTGASSIGMDICVITFALCICGEKCPNVFRRDFGPKSITA